MPLISAVGRDQSCSRTLKPISPAGVTSPISPRKPVASKPRRAPLLELLARGLPHVVVKAGNRDAALRVMQRGEHADRIDCRAAIEPGMQIARRPKDGDLGEGKSAQEGGDGRGVFVPLPRIANE